jgi:hypothetical protein
MLTMLNSKRLGKLAGVFGMVVLGLIISIIPVGANVQYSQKFWDNFSHTYLQPDHRANWWIINAGYDSATNSQGFFEDFCGPSSCFENVDEQDDQYARLKLFPNNEPGYFINVDVAEEHSGYPAEIENSWFPTVERPVEMNTTVRWSETYNQTGDAGARGTNGVWLWDSPYDFADYDPEAPINAFGFNYAPFDTLAGFAGGLKITVMSFGFPVVLTNVPVQVDMQEWNDFKFVWSVDANGAQSLAVTVNGADAGTYALPFPLPALSTEIWQDNEFANFNEFGGVAISYDVIPAEQSFDLDYYSVRYLGE